MRRFLAGLLAALMVLSLCACAATDTPAKTDGQAAAVSWDELVFDRTMPLRYAEQFTVEYAGDSYKRITIHEFEITEDGQIVKAEMTNEKIPTPDVPQTGDESNLGFWIGLGSIALGGAIACGILFAKRKKDDDSDE